MIRSEFGHTNLRGNNASIMVDYICVTESIKDMLVKDCYMTEEQAKDKILESVGTAFYGYEALKEKHGECTGPEPETGIIEKIKRKWRKRK